MDIHVKQQYRSKSNQAEGFVAQSALNLVCHQKLSAKHPFCEALHDKILVIRSKMMRLRNLHD